MGSLLGHGEVCLAADPMVRAAFLASDAVIWLSYCAISTLLVLVVRGTPILTNALLLMFGAFIFLCGQTHLFRVFSLLGFLPTTHTTLYEIDAFGVHAMTALVSAATVVAIAYNYHWLRQIALNTKEFTEAYYAAFAATFRTRLAEAEERKRDA